MVRYVSAGSPTSPVSDTGRNRPQRGVGMLVPNTDDSASLLLLKLCHSHGNRQLLRQCFGNVCRH